MEQVMAALKEIQDTQRETRAEIGSMRADSTQRAVMIAEIRTTLLGPEGQPEAGLVSKVGRIANRTTRLERIAGYSSGVVGLAGFIFYNLSTLKSIFGMRS